MSEIIIPERLAMRLSHDKTWESCVTQFTKNIEPLLAKDPDFFPDYTIHGIDHINRCLDIADHLIDIDTLSKEPEEKKKDLLTPRDVMFLVCGIMLHDMGMFLRPDGLRKLVQMDHGVDAFGGKSWKQEWSDYVDRTKRLSQEKMRYHFGKVVPVTEDCVDHTDTDDNKRIIGEFLRQHHARLAHELALEMLPGTAGTDLFANMTLPQKARDLIGILARSHGMAIRDTELYVKNHIGEGAKPYNTPVFYLMTVLRTADALDADERRAPEALERQQKIHVPISVEEWTWNQCIDPDACDWRMDHKNRYIEAAPQSSLQYVQLDKWLKGVQEDLDLCWSILAEKYPYDRYRLSIHRVISNIHEPGIQKTMNEEFLTKEVKITANPEIVKLMMEPLYGDDPTYGVRELLQNAVDACLERKEWEEKHNNNPDYKGLVDIRIEGDTFTITDNGMGMNENVLLNYYLSAGASYRSSEAWMAANAPDGESRVARTGKFGVGFLASFLLGDRIEVHTQHRNDKKGLKLAFTRDSMLLDVEREKRFNPYAAGEDKKDDPVGTTITIRMRAEVHERLLKDVQLKQHDSWYIWYVFDDPIVQYHFDGALVADKEPRIPREPDGSCSWLRMESPQFKNYLWKYQDKNKFYCNGIYIPHFKSNIGSGYGLPLDTPSVSLIDLDAVLDVNLSRTSVHGFPEEKLLVRELYRCVIAGLLASEWNYHSGCRIFPYRFVPCLQSSKGFLPNHPVFRSAAKISRFLSLCLMDDVAWGCGSADPVIPEFVTGNFPFMLLSPWSSFHRLLSAQFDDMIPYLLEPLFSKHDTETYMDYQSVGVNCWISEKAYACLGETPFPYQPLSTYLREGDAVHEDSMLKWELSKVPFDSPIWRSVSEKETGWVRHVTPEFVKAHQERYAELKMPIERSHYPSDAYAFAVDCLTADQNPSQPSLFTEMLFRYLGSDLWIPYDMEARKAKFQDAFAELEPYMKYLEKYPYF